MGECSFFIEIKQVSLNLLIYSHPIVTSQGYAIMRDIAEVAPRIFFDEPGDLAVRFKFNTEMKAILQKATSNHSFNLEGPIDDVGKSKCPSGCNSRGI